MSFKRPIFNEEGLCIIEGESKTRFLLSKKTWDHIVSEGERKIIELNYDSFEDTLKFPEVVVPSEQVPDRYIYYKKIQRIMILPNVTVPKQEFYFAIVIRSLGQDKYQVVTAYPTKKIRTKN